MSSHGILCRMMLAAHINQEKCLNNHGENTPLACTRCEQACPANAIKLGVKTIPQLDTSACTGCTACVCVCPVDAIGHESSQPVELLQQVHRLTMQGDSTIHAACSAVCADDADVNIPCHAMWNPILLACMAAEGVATLELEGMSQCDTCPVRYGANVMQQTEKDYATLNNALGVHMVISRQIRPRQRDIQVTTKGSVAHTEPPRRAFFRSLIPSIAQGAAMAAAQIGQAASQSIREEIPQENASHLNLPVRLRLFLRALPRLQANFTPVPPMLSLPIGAIQADARCTACNQCVEQCPTQAISIREFGANKVLEFQPDACIGCQQCIALCPEDALEHLPGISLPAMLTQRVRPLVMVPVNTSKTAADC